jgi:tetratricopeptide (TPR) repeat protein
VFAEESANQRAVAHVCAWLIWCCGFAGRIEEGLGYAKKAIANARYIEGDGYPYIKSIGGISWLLTLNGRNKEAFEYSRDLIKFGESRGNLRGMALGYFTLGVNHSFGGDPETALDDCRKGLALNADPLYQTLLRYIYGNTCVLSGHFGDGEEALNQVIEYSRENGIKGIEWPSITLLGMTKIANGEMNKGYQLLDSLYMFDEKQNLLLTSGLNINFAVGEYMVGMMFSQMAAPTAPLKFSMLIRNLSFILKHTPFAMKKAVIHYERSIVGCQKCGLNTWLAMPYLELGRLYKKKGKKTLAKKNLLLAIETSKKYEVKGCLQQAEALLATLEGK